MDLPTISLFNNSSPATGNFISGAGEPTTGNNQILRPAKRPVGRPKGSKNKRQVVSPPLGSQSLNSTAVIGIPTGEATDNNHILRPPKRPVGRPKGSKNQAKTPPPPFKIEESQNSTTAVIEIPAGANVEQSLLQFCLRRQVSITVLTAFGQLSNIITCHQPIQTILGPFPILSLSGTVNPIPPSGSMNSPESNFPLTVLLSLPNGLTIGGIVGKVATAASKVKVVAIPTTVQNNATFETLRVDDIQANNSHVEITPLSNLPAQNHQFSEFCKACTSGDLMKNRNDDNQKEKDEGQDLMTKMMITREGDIWRYDYNLHPALRVDRFWTN